MLLLEDGRPAFRSCMKRLAGSMLGLGTWLLHGMHTVGTQLAGIGEQPRCMRCKKSIDLMRWRVR